MKNLLAVTIVFALLAAGIGLVSKNSENKPVAKPSITKTDKKPKPPPADKPHKRPTVQGLPVIPGAYRFISHPDFLNQDVGDITQSRFWQPGMPKGTNKTYETSLNFVLNDMVKQKPSAVFAAGDLVEGSWGQDILEAGVFGPTNTTTQRIVALKEAARVYFGQWAQRFKQKGLTVYPAVGDHEIGDNPWRPNAKSSRNDWLAFKQNHTWLWKKLFVKWVYGDVNSAENTNLAQTGAVSQPLIGQAKDTAYAVRLNTNLLLVTIDVFRPDPKEGIAVLLDTNQRIWLEDVLRQAKQQQIPWVIVQGHTPVMGPVRTRFSSALTYQGTDLLPLMRRYEVDVYLCGEVHDTTFIKRKGLVQISHGGLFYHGESTYLVGQVAPKRLLIETRYFNGKTKWKQGKLWSTEGGDGAFEVMYDKPSRVVGAYELRHRADGTNFVVVTRGISAAQYKN